jgi:hypothetical protein
MPWFGHTSQQLITLVKQSCRVRAALLGIKLRLEIGFRDVARALTIDGVHSAAIELAVIRNDEDLPATIGKHAVQFDVTAALRDGEKAEIPQNRKQLSAREALKFSH